MLVLTAGVATIQGRKQPLGQAFPNRLKRIGIEHGLQLSRLVFLALLPLKRQELVVRDGLEELASSGLTWIATRDGARAVVSVRIGPMQRPQWSIVARTPAARKLTGVFLSRLDVNENA